MSGSNPSPSQPSRRVKLCRVSGEIMVDLLQMDGTRTVRIDGMPDDARLCHCQYDYDYNRLVLLVESDTFEEVPEGATPPDLDLECHKLADRRLEASVN